MLGLGDLTFLRALNHNGYIEEPRPEAFYCKFRCAEILQTWVHVVS